MISSETFNIKKLPNKPELEILILKIIFRSYWSFLGNVRKNW